jgi:cytochrome b6-f complex iron-sulfur subunit
VVLPAGYVDLPARDEVPGIDVPAHGNQVACNRRMPRRLDLQDRREFCKRLASAAACTGGLALLPGCSGGGNGAGGIPGSPLSTVTGTPANGAVTVTIAASSPLASTGGMALVTSPAGIFLVTRTSATAFLAVTAQCTHEACVVSNATGTSYVCPCHGSEFDSSGRVIVGPASAPLRQFQTQFANNVLTIG